MNRTIYLSGFLFFIFSVQLFAQEEKPDEIVKETVSEILTILANTDLTEQEKKQKVFDIADNRINFLEMSRRVLATNWRKASQEQQEMFIDRFSQILLNNYWVRIKRYAGEQVEYTAVTYDSTDIATVDTVIVQAGDVRIPISYRMKRIVSIWYAYDFIIEHLSLVQSFRNEYAAIIKNSGIEDVLSYMRSEIDASSES
ncbi:MAG: ABC transporter substrate-binding protein [Pseudomonadota bacterium]